MLSFPLITRELRVQSRQRVTYFSRFFWGLAVLGMLLIFTWSFSDQANHGSYLLSTIHLCLAVIFCVIAPVGASDSISREKREGTLGLLMLTQLSPTQVVLGKIASHGIRLFYLALMMLPFIMIPVMMGGVGFSEFLICSLILLFLAVTGTCAGLIASALFVGFGTALAAGLIFSILAVVVIGGFVANSIVAGLPNNFPSDIPVTVRALLLGPGVILFPLQAKEVTSMFFRGQLPFWLLLAGLLLLTALLFIFALFFSARKVAEHAELSGETRRQAAFRQRFLTPFLWRNRFRSWMRRRLDRNPFIWLEYRTAWARAARWAMILLVIVMETMLAIELPDRGEYLAIHLAALLFIVFFLTLKSSSSFQREKESGAFELLLVTPLSEREIVGGRLRAVASYYLPTLFTLGLLGVVGLSFALSPFYFESSHSGFALNFTMLAGSLFSIPVCGLFFALYCKRFFPALLWTGGLGIIAPACLWSALNGMVWYVSTRLGVSPVALSNAFHFAIWPVLLGVVAYHSALVIYFRRATIKLLRDRQFTARG